MRRALLLFALAATALTLGLAPSVLVNSISAAGPPGSGAPHTLPVGTSGATQLGVAAVTLPAGVTEAEMKLAHESNILPPAGTNTAYSFSIVGITNTSWQMRMGYIVLSSDGGGLARYFMQVYDDSIWPNVSVSS